MQDLINKLKETAGVSDEQAKKTITVISEYLKDKMPKSFHSQIDNMLDGGTLSEGVKEKIMDVAVDAKEKTEDVFDDVKDKLKGLFTKKKD
jgi:uncharacterized protein (DUF2267 family)